MYYTMVVREIFSDCTSNISGKRDTTVFPANQPLAEVETQSEVWTIPVARLWAATASFLRRIMSTKESGVPARAVVDHLLLGAADLETGLSWVEKLTAVRAVIGGSHPGVGTRNALLSLGSRQYLEIIAPDPTQTAFNFHIDIQRLTRPRLITWAALTNDIDSIANYARKAGHQISGPRDGSRVRPDGVVLQWRTLGIANHLGGPAVEPIPFFIQWAAGSAHPSQDSPQGCELQSFEIEHPEPASVTQLLNTLEMEVPVKPGKNVGLIATLRTSMGVLRLT